MKHVTTEPPGDVKRSPFPEVPAKEIGEARRSMFRRMNVGDAKGAKVSLEAKAKPMDQADRQSPDSDEMLEHNAEVAKEQAMERMVVGGIREAEGSEVCVPSTGVTRKLS